MNLVLSLFTLLGFFEVTKDLLAKFENNGFWTNLKSITEKVLDKNQFRLLQPDMTKN